jgi:rifampin ADP-ribosylating transferase
MHATCEMHACDGERQALIADKENADMNKGVLSTTDDLRTKRFYHGTRAELKPGDLIEPSKPPDVGESARRTTYVYLTANLDGAIWEAEVASGEGPGRVCIVEPIGEIEDDPDPTDQTSTGHPSMSCRSREPLQVIGEVTKWTFYHGTRADLKPGDVIKPGHTPNFGKKDRTTNYVYLTRTLNAAVWGAELAAGEGPGRIYIVEPTGPIEDDPNLTNKKFRGNPTKSYRSGAPLRVTGEITDWQGHSPEALKAMKDGLERLKRLGVEPIDD